MKKSTVIELTSELSTESLSPPSETKTASGRGLKVSSLQLLV